MAKCQIKWIDSQGNDTPDNNESVTLIQCMGSVRYFPEGGSIQSEPSDVYHCCETHLKIMEREFNKPRMCFNGTVMDLGWRIVEDIRANTRE